MNNKYINYIGLNLSMLLVLIIVLDLNTSLLEYPILYHGDALYTLMNTKMLMNGDLPFYSYAVSNYIGTPYPFISADFPAPRASNMLLMKSLSIFSTNAFVVTNIYMVLSYFMILNTMYFILRRLKVNIYIAFAIALLYTLVPFHYLRSGHLYYMNYFLLPIAIYYLLLLWRKKPLFFILNTSKKKYKLDLSIRNFIIILFLIIFSIWNFYYTFFFVILLVAVTISTFYYRRNKYHLFSSFIMLFFLITPFIINLVPYKMYQYNNEKNLEVANRNFGQSELYGLRITQMLLPTTKHNNTLLAELKDTYNEDPLIRNNENESSTLGIIGSIGFLIMTLFILFNEKVMSTVKKLSIISYVGVMVATIGGYSSLFALLITPSIRGYNRISIFIATIALIVFAICISQLMKKYSINKIAQSLIALFILLIGIYDQVPSSISLIPITDTFISDREFIQNIEKQVTLEENKKILQLPYMSYPEHNPINNMYSYDQSIGFLHSKDIQWSYGAMKGRESDAWLKTITDMPIQEQINILKSSGFCGIYIDRRGYKDNGLELETKISKLLNTTPSVSKDSLKSFFYFKATGNKIYDVSCFIKGFDKNFYAWEGKRGSFGWTKGNTILELVNNSKKIKKIDLSFTIGTLQKRNILLKLNDKEVKSIYLQDRGHKPIRLSLDLLSGINKLEFITDTDAKTPGSTDLRKLAFSISNLESSIVE